MSQPTIHVLQSSPETVSSGPNRSVDAPGAMILTAADSVAILQVVALADALATARDADGYVKLFTAEATMDGAMGTAAGRAQLRETVARVWAEEPKGTLYLTSNAVIDVEDSDVVVHSVMMTLATRPMPAVLGAARVRQKLVRTDRAWRIAERTITM
jgi:uncharacterized protein (TIGR02246 family)